MKQHYRVFSWALATLAGVGVVMWLLSTSETDSPELPVTTVSDSESVSPTAAEVSNATNLADTHLNQPARFAFISDKSAPTLAVLDTYDDKLLPQIALKTIADTIGISRYGGYLAYAKHGDKQLFRFDLKTKQHQSFNVSQPIAALAVHFGGHWIAYTGKDGSGIVDTRNGKETVISTKGAVSLLYPPGADSLLIAETERGRIQRINLVDMQTQTLLDSGSPMSAISVMPNGMAFFFVAGGMLQRYSLLDNTLQTLAVSAMPWRPYVTSDSRLVLLLSDVEADGTPQLLAVNTYTYAVKYRFDLADWQAPAHGNDEAIATGWLEQIAVVADNNSMYSLAISEQPAVQRHHTPSKTAAPGAIRDMLVQSDSKTLLATRENSDKLWIFNLREQRFDTPLPLGLEQPDIVVMGETNTLCH